MKSYSITVKVEHDEEAERSIISIETPKDQELLDLPRQAITLAGGIALIIRRLETTTEEYNLGMKEDELMKQIVDYLQREFVSNESFNDGFTNDDYKDEEK